MGKIKNIIFDLGGVILNIDYHKTSDAFKQLGAVDFDYFYSQHGANKLFEDLETGQITELDFYNSMQQHCQVGTTHQQIQQAWNAILVGFRKESVAFLDNLKERYNIYLLSNTNSIHKTEFSKMFTEETGKLNFDDFFVKAWYSHLLHLRKPYPTTYTHVLNEAGLLANETLFIDDSKVNIEGAMEAGLQTHWLLPGEKIELLNL